MTDHPTYPTRRRLRLEGYDYATAGLYFVTVCTAGRQPIFGTIRNGQMRLSPAGLMVQDVWNNLPEFSPGMTSDAFIVMPDHVHGIIVLDPGDEESSPRSSLPQVLHRFKSYTTSRYRLGVRDSGWAVLAQGLWQRSYFERVIRSDRELDAARRYIAGNVEKWEASQERSSSARMD